MTARTDIEDRLEGLKRGADAYLSKPFQEEELRLHMHNLLAMRQRLQAYFSEAAGEEEPENGREPSRDKEPGSADHVI